MKTIDNRNDIHVLVNKFYVKIRKDELLGPIFTRHIANDKWPEHLDKLTDFWEMKLFATPNFRGNPTQKHIHVDKNLNHTMEVAHFEAWVKLWFETIDELYEGDVAKRAKIMSTNMAKGQLSQVQHHRAYHDLNPTTKSHT